MNKKRDFDAPIRRFLQSRVGKLWDEVWSEVCGRTDDWRLRENLNSWVATSCRIEDGNVYDERGYKVLSWHEYIRFYVHPESGLLMQAPSEPKQKREKKPPKIVKMGENQYFKHEGIWYRVKTEPVPSPGWFGYPVQYLSKDVFKTKNFEVTYGERVCVVWKQQANSRECKVLNNGFFNKRES